MLQSTIDSGRQDIKRVPADPGAKNGRNIISFLGRLAEVPVQPRRLLLVMDLNDGERERLEKTIFSSGEKGRGGGGISYALSGLLARPMWGTS